MVRMDATLFVHPAQLMDYNSKKIDQIDYKFYTAKKTVILKKWVEYVPHFWRLKYGLIGRRQCKSLST